MDGNTRVGAYLKRGVTFQPALIIDVAWESASEKRREELYMLGATANSQNGRPLTAKERRANIRHALALNWTTEHIERVLGLKTGVIVGVRREIAAEQRLADVGMGSNGELKGASLRALGKASAVGLHNDPYKELAQLSADAGLNASEIDQLAKEVKDSDSDEEVLRVLSNVRSEMGERIREREFTETPSLRSLGSCGPTSGSSTSTSTTSLL